MRTFLKLQPDPISPQEQKYVLTVDPNREAQFEDELATLVRSLYSDPDTRTALGDLIPQAWDSLGFSSEQAAWDELNDQFYPDSESKLERGEFGECVSYAVFEEYLSSQVPAKKLWYGKTSSKQPVFGKDVLAFTQKADGSIEDFLMIEVKTSLDTGSLSGNIFDLEQTIDKYTFGTFVKELDQVKKVANLSFFAGDGPVASKLIEFYHRWRDVLHCCLIVVDSASIPRRCYDENTTTYVGRLRIPSEATGRQYKYVLVLAHPQLKAWAARIYTKGGICRV